MAKDPIDLIFDDIFDAIFDTKGVGRLGEKMTVWELRLAKLFGRSGKILRNVYVPKENGETSEIDVLFITQKGIFVFESKNYSGWIFGDEKSPSWTAMLPNRTKNQFYNPIMQNRTHIKWLNQFLGGEVPLFSMVVFSERCELKEVTVDSDDVYVIKRDMTYAAIREVWKRKPDILNSEQINALYEKLKLLTNVDEAVKAAHVETINRKFKSDSKETVNKQRPAEDVIQENTPVCPRCGAKLILRMARKGANAGNQFYGCSDFPRCRYIQNV